MLSCGWGGKIGFLTQGVPERSPAAEPFLRSKNTE